MPEIGLLSFESSVCNPPKRKHLPKRGCFPSSMAKPVCSFRKKAACCGVWKKTTLKACENQAFSWGWRVPHPWTDQSGLALCCCCRMNPFRFQMMKTMLSTKLDWLEGSDQEIEFSNFFFRFSCVLRCCALMLFRRWTFVDLEGRWGNLRCSEDGSEVIFVQHSW